MEPRLATAIAHVPGWSAANVIATPMGGGITNTTYRVEIGGVAFVLRLGAPGAASLGIDRGRELQALRGAEQLGIGATVVHSDLDHDVLVTSFIEGHTLNAEAFQAAGVAERAGASVRKLHDARGLVLGGAPFSVFDTIRSYVTALGPLPPLFISGVELANRLEGVLPRSAHLSPCHNDLLPANLIDDGSQIRIIDWEYAAMGDPYFDLAALCANACLDEALARRFLTAYLARAPRANERARLSLMRIASDLREGFWGLVQRTTSSLDFDYDRYATDHVERALARAGTPHIDAELSAVQRDEGQ